jgi:hypothetical protein
LEQAVLVDCGKGRNKMLLKSCNCKFGGVDPVIVGWDEVDMLEFYLKGTYVTYPYLEYLRYREPVPIKLTRYLITTKPRT